MKLSLITICKGRLQFLKRTLFNMCHQTHHDYELIVVDYGCPENTAEEVSKFIKANPTVSCDVKIIKVSDKTKLWNASRARNIGANHSKGEWLFFIDADNIMTSAGLELILGSVKNHKLLTTTSSAIGSCLIDRETFFSIRGYDERNIGWGCEDTQLYRRIREAGISCGMYSSKYIQVISHSNELRTKFTNFNNELRPEDNLHNGLNYNLNLLNDTDNINKHGFGISNKFDVIEHKKPSLIGKVGIDDPKTPINNTLYIGPGQIEYTDIESGQYDSYAKFNTKLVIYNPEDILGNVGNIKLTKEIVLDYVKSLNWVRAFKHKFREVSVVSSTHEEAIHFKLRGDISNAEKVNPNLYATLMQIKKVLTNDALV